MAKLIAGYDGLNGDLSTGTSYVNVIAMRNGSDVTQETVSGSGNREEEDSTRILAFLLGTLYAIIIVVSLLGNLMVIIAVLSTHKLKTITNYLLMSLAVADMTVTILVLPYALVYDVTGYWMFGETFCLFWMSWDVSCCTASLQHLCAVSIDRYLAINDPFHYYERMSRGKVIIMIMTIWINSFSISFFPIFLGLYRKPGHKFDPSQCFLDINQPYAVISASISFYIPFLIMGCCYYKILSIALKQAQEISCQQRSLDHNVNREDAHKLSSKSRSLASERKAIKTLGIVFGFFYICWQPFFILYWIYAFGEGEAISNWVRSAITWLGYINSAMNPIVYALNPDFRQAYSRILRNIAQKICGESFLKYHCYGSHNGSGSSREAHETPGSTPRPSRASVRQISRNYSSPQMTKLLAVATANHHCCSENMIDEPQSKLNNVK